MDAFLFYAYWNGAQIRDLFEGLASITASSAFGQFAALIFLLGMIIVIAMGAVKSEGRPAIAYFACAVLFWGVAVVPKTTVSIQDIRSETVYTVDNVPLGIGVFGSIANRAGYWLSRLYEDAFAPVDVARFSRFGAVYPERILEVLQSVGPVTVEGMSTIKAVVTGCIVPELLTDQTKAARLIKSTDIWKDVSAAGWVNPARLTALPTGEVKKCPDAMKYADDIMRDVELPALKMKLGAKLAPDHASPEAVITSALPQAEGLLLNLSRTMDASLKHSLMLSAIPEAAAGAAAGKDDPLSAAVGLAKAQGNLASEINYRTMAKIAQDALPKIRNALEFIVIGAFPVIVLMALVSGSAMGSIVRSYVTLLVTIQVWPALSSIVNYLMITYDAHPFGVIASQFGGNSLQAAALIRETGATSQAMAGALMCAVPVIAYALVRAGDVAVGQLVGGLTAPAQSAASSQGSSLAAGNVSQGNVQLSNVQSNNTSANKFDRSIVASHPGTLVSTSAFGSVTRSDEGQVTGMTRTPVNFGVSSTTTQSFTRGHASSNVSQMTSSWADAARFSFTQSATSSDSVQRGFAHALRDAINKEIGTMDAYSRSERTGSSLVVDRGVELASENIVSEGVDIGTGGGMFGQSATQLVDSRLMKSTNNAMSKVLKSPSEKNTSLPSPLRSIGQIRVENIDLTKTGDDDNGSASLLAINNDFLDVERFGRIGLRAEFSLNDAQQLVDRAITRNGSSSSKQQSEAFEIVKNAVDRVAKNHSDESIRSVARNFSESLGSSRQAVIDNARIVSDSISASSSVIQNMGSEFTTSIDDSVDAMNMAIAQHLSPERALKAMYSSDVLSDNAAKYYEKKRFGFGPADDFGPGTIVSARKMNVDFSEKSKTSLESSIDGFSSRIPQDVSSSRMEDVEFQSDFVKDAYAVSLDEISKEYRSESSDLTLHRGILLVSQAIYRDEAENKNFALRNAFFGAYGYESGEQIQEKLLVISSGNEEARRVLEEIGERKSHGLTENDLERVLKTIKND